MTERVCVCVRVLRSGCWGFDLGLWEVVPLARKTSLRFTHEVDANRLFRWFARKDCARAGKEPRLAKVVRRKGGMTDQLIEECDAEVGFSTKNTILQTRNTKHETLNPKPKHYTLNPNTISLELVRRRLASEVHHNTRNPKKEKLSLSLSLSLSL